jgi:hypothetical protein
VAVSSSSASHRLREIAADLSSIPAFEKVQTVPELKVDSGRAFLEAIDLGAFSGRKYRKLQKVVQQQKTCGDTAGWEGALWDEVVKCLLPEEYHDFTCSAPACKLIAKMIAEEATRLEVAAERKQGETWADAAEHPASQRQLSSGEGSGTPGQGDKKGDKRKTSPRPLTDDARACIRKYKAKIKAGKKTTMKAVILDHIGENGGSFWSIKKSLSDNSSEWNPRAKQGTQ